MHWNVLAENAGMLFAGLIVTLEVSLLALVIALALGILVAVCRVAPVRALRRLGTAYVEFFRNIPLLVQIFFLYFALPNAGISIPAFWCGVLALGVYTAAFVAEAIRSGIAAVPSGQLEAALASGLPYAAAMRAVVLPQAIRLTIPPLGNTVLNLIKNSSLVSAISILDILGSANSIGARTFAYVPLFAGAALLYLVLTLPTAWFVNVLERRLGDRPPMNLGWLFNPQILSFLAGGLGVTLELAAVSIAISFVLGVLLALARLSHRAIVRVPATIYIEGMRALPVFLIILFAYLALPKLVGTRISPFVAGVVALSAFTAALIAEIVRAGILAVPSGIVEAATAQGFNSLARMRLIVMPIALRQMTPALTAQFVTLLKDTSLTAVIGNLDLLRRAQIVDAQPPFQPIPVFALVALTYFAINYTLSQFSRRLETAKR